MGKFDESSSSHIGVSSIIKFIQDQIDLINIKLNSLSITPILEKISNFPFGTSGKANKNIDMENNLIKFIFSIHSSYKFCKIFFIFIFFSRNSKIIFR